MPVGLVVCHPTNLARGDYAFTTLPSHLQKKIYVHSLGSRRMIQGLIRCRSGSLAVVLDFLRGRDGP